MSDWERRLPHWIPEQTPIFVTWRLAGTLPRVAQQQSWMDSDAQLDRTASGPRWLAQPALARIVTEALRYVEAVRGWYRLHAWVVLPNHVHCDEPATRFLRNHALAEVDHRQTLHQFLERTGGPGVTRGVPAAASNRLAARRRRSIRAPRPPRHSRSRDPGGGRCAPPDR